MRKYLKALSVGIVATAMAGAIDFAAADVLRLGGTGAATEMLRQVGAAFVADSQDEIEVVPSLGSSGGIAAVADGVIDIAVSGRPLRTPEQARGLAQAVSARTPFGMVTSHPGPVGLKSAQVAALFKSEGAKWADGTPVRIVLRPKSESDNALLGRLFPGMAAAIEAARARTDVPIAATDRDNLDLAQRMDGSLVGATLTQVRMEQRSLRFVALDGVEPTLENFETGAYPHGKTFHFVHATDRRPIAARFLAFVESAQGRQVLRRTGTLPGTSP